MPACKSNVQFSPFVNIQIPLTVTPTFLTELVGRISFQIIVLNILVIFMQDTVHFLAFSLVVLDYVGVG